MKVGGIDLGSNTFILTVVDFGSAGEPVVLIDEVRYVRLGEGVDKTKRFNDEALSRARAALAEFSELLRRYQVQNVKATATSAARDAQNGEALLKLCEQFQIPVEVITGSREAELSFWGSRFFSKLSGWHWVIDIGGGSTELILGEGDRFVECLSLNLGCVRLKNRWERDVLAMANDIRDELKRRIPQEWIKKGEKAVGVAGTPIELLRVHLAGNLSIERAEGQELRQSDILKIRQTLERLSAPELTAQYGTPLGRADVLLQGAVLLEELMFYLGIEVIRVSRGGIRYGLVLELAGKQDG